MTDQKKKFFFDINNFDEDALRKQREAARRPTFGQDDMEAARLSGFEQGVGQGKRDSIDALEVKILDAMQDLVTQTQILAQAESIRRAQFIDLATLMAAQLFASAIPLLAQSLSVAQIEHFIRNVIEDHVQKKAEILIMVAPAMFDAIDTRLAKLGQTRATWKVEANPQLDDLECRIEWAGGGAEWNPALVHRDIRAALLSHLPADLRTQAEAAFAEPVALAPVTPHTDDVGAI